MQVLDKESGTAKSLPFENFKPGDTVEVMAKDFVTAKRSTRYSGIVLAIRKRGLGSNFTILNAIDGEPIEFTFQHYSPLIESVKILEHKFVKPGDKKVRRAKLYYVRKWPFTRFTIP
jgi:large subunit ribosomal protein L19